MVVVVVIAMELRSRVQPTPVFTFFSPYLFESLFTLVLLIHTKEDEENEEEKENSNSENTKNAALLPRLPSRVRFWERPFWDSIVLAFVVER